MKETIEKLKNINKEVIKKWIISYLPYMVYFVLATILVKRMYLSGDDNYFVTVLNDNSLFNWISIRYNTWSSRIILEGIMVTLLHSGIRIWKVFNIAIFMILPYALNKLLNTKNDLKLKWLICLVAFLIPADCYGDAGWVATSMNYLWPLAFGLLAFIPLKKNISNEKMNAYEIVLYAISAIIACNQEQMAGVLAIAYFMLIIYNIIKKKKIDKTIILYFAIIVLSLIFILTCPGVDQRNISEINTWFPTYGELNLIDKIELGIVSMMRYISVRGRLVSICFTALIMYAVFVTNKNKWCRLVGIVSFIGSMPLNIINKLTPENFEVVKNSIYWFNAPNMAFSEFANKNIIMYLIILYYIIVLGCITLSLYLIFKNTHKSIISISILGVGVISRMVMGFSPTVYASQERPTIFLYASFIVLIIYIWKHLEEIEKNKNIAYVGVILISIASYLKNLIAIH